MSLESRLKVFLGPFALLFASFVMYLLRYPLWYSPNFVELIFVMLILSYLLVLILALFLLKRDSKKSISNFFRVNEHSMISVGVVFALLYLGIWYLLSFFAGSRFEITPFASLSGYENYSVYLLPLAFALQLVFVIFGAFAEEVAYRGYVQTRIASKYGLISGIFVATLFFALQHIHIFQATWIANFFQTRFLHVILFGIFTGYLFFKSKENIWSVFSFHVLVNIIGVSIPLVVTASSLFASQFVDILSFVLIILLVHYLFMEPTRKV